MNEYIKRSDVLALLPDTDTVGYKPSALREKVLALPYMTIGMDTAEEEKDSDREKMEKVHGICEEICGLIGDLVTEGIIDHSKGIKTVLKLAGTHAEWMKKTFGAEKGRAFIASVKDKESPKEPTQRPERTDKERLAYVHGIVGKITDMCAELTKAGVWGFSEGLDFAFALTGEQIGWTQKNFPPVEVLKFMLKI